MKNKTLFEFIKDNWQTWPTNADFAKAHDISPQRLNNWLKNKGKPYTTDGKNVYSGTTGKKAYILTPEGDGVEFKIRGIEQCRLGQAVQSTNAGQAQKQEEHS